LASGPPRPGTFHGPSRPDRMARLLTRAVGGGSCPCKYCGKKVSANQAEGHFMKSCAESRGLPLDERQRRAQEHLAALERRRELADDGDHYESDGDRDTSPRTQRPVARTTVQPTPVAKADHSPPRPPAAPPGAPRASGDAGASTALLDRGAAGAGSRPPGAAAGALGAAGMPAAGSAASLLPHQHQPWQRAGPAEPAGGAYAPSAGGAGFPAAQSDMPASVALSGPQLGGLAGSPGLPPHLPQQQRQERQRPPTPASGDWLADKALSGLGSSPPASPPHHPARAPSSSQWPPVPHTSQPARPGQQPPPPAPASATPGSSHTPHLPPSGGAPRYAGAPAASGSAQPHPGAPPPRGQGATAGAAAAGDTRGAGASGGSPLLAGQQGLPQSQPNRVAGAFGSLPHTATQSSSSPHPPPPTSHRQLPYQQPQSPPQPQQQQYPAPPPAQQQPVYRSSQPLQQPPPNQPQRPQQPPNPQQQTQPEPPLPAQGPPHGPASQPPGAAAVQPGAAAGGTPGPATDPRVAAGPAAYVDFSRPLSAPASGGGVDLTAEKKLEEYMRASARPRKQYKLPTFLPYKWEGYREDDRYFSSLPPCALHWLQQVRGLSEEVIRRNRLFCTQLPVEGGRLALAVAFPFFKHGSMVFAKYRLFDPDSPTPFEPKLFRSSKDGEPVMYGFDDVAAAHRQAAQRGGGGGGGSVIIVEGEMDKLALNTAGFWNVVSVPNGAPAARTPPGSSEPQQLFSRPGPAGVEEGASRFKQHYGYMDSFLQLFPDMSRCSFVIATDNDPAGQALRRELMRRLGRERCWEVTSWDNEELNMMDEEAQAAGLGPGAAAELGAGVPAAGSAPPGSPHPGRPRGFRKDANDVLIHDGPERLRQRLEAAQPAKLTGLATFKEYEYEIINYFQRQDPLQLGVPTGWPSLDRLYRVAPGELTIVTGIPNSGKSEWLDALLVNLAENHGWAFALCSMEKTPLPHLKSLIAKRMRKPFPHVYSTARGPQQSYGMDLGEMVGGFRWVADHFHLIRFEEQDDTGSPPIDWVLHMARIAVLRFGIRGLVIDPYNELDSRRPRDMTETDHIRELLSKVRRFARESECHVWFVAHPRQQKGFTGQAPGLYDISGSAHWFNKTDNGIVVHRRFTEVVDPVSGKRYRQSLPEVDIKLQKVRNKDIGTQGETHLLYDKATGRYVDPERLAQRLQAGSGGGGGGGGGYVAPQCASDLRDEQLGYLPFSGSPPDNALAAPAGVIDTSLDHPPPTPPALPPPPPQQQQQYEQQQQQPPRAWQPPPPHQLPPASGPPPAAQTRAAPGALPRPPASRALPSAARGSSSSSRAASSSSSTSTSSSAASGSRPRSSLASSRAAGSGGKGGRGGGKLGKLASMRALQAAPASKAVAAGEAAADLEDEDEDEEGEMDEDEDEDEEYGGNGGPRRRSPPPALPSGPRSVQVSVNGGAYADKAPEGMGSVYETVAENEGWLGGQ
ncbi:hypothetical protein Agub_g4737, partial [Astrephomene gubernaculifera]